MKHHLPTEPSITFTHNGVEVKLYYFTAVKTWMARWRMPCTPANQELFLEDYPNPKMTLSDLVITVQQSIERITGKVDED